MLLRPFLEPNIAAVLAHWRAPRLDAGRAHTDAAGVLSDRDAEALLRIVADDDAARSDAAAPLLPPSAIDAPTDAVLAELAQLRASALAVLRSAGETTIDAFDVVLDRFDRVTVACARAHDAATAQRTRRLEVRLRESDERYRGIVSTALDYGIFSTDADGIIRSWPSGAHAVFGWTAEEAIGQHAGMTFTAEDRAAGVPEQEMRTAHEQGSAPDVRWHARKDGDRVFIEGVMRPILGTDGETTGFLKVGRDATERHRWDERQQVLLKELQHRTRNIMAVVLAVFEKTRASSADIEALSTTYRSRLGALVRVQELLSRLKESDRVDFDMLLRNELASMGALDADGTGERVRLSGPTGVRLRSGSLQTFALALHELATNAAKYGALVQPQGRLSVTWHLTDESGVPWLHIDWRERGVDMARAARVPGGGGYGRELIERALPYQLGARTRYALGHDGVHCTIAVPISATTSAMGDAPRG